MALKCLEVLHLYRWLNEDLFFSSTDSLRRTRLFLLVLLLLGIYGLSKTPFLSGKGSFSDTGLLTFHSLSLCLCTVVLPCHRRDVNLNVKDHE